MGDIIDTGLLIGGLFDGQRRKVTHGTTLRVVIPPKVPVTQPEDVQNTANLDVATYHRRILNGGSERFLAWVSADISLDEAMAKLLNGYKPSG